MKYVVTAYAIAGIVMCREADHFFPGRWSVDILAPRSSLNLSESSFLPRAVVGHSDAIGSVRGDSACWSSDFDFERCCSPSGVRHGCWDRLMRPEICCFGPCVTAHKDDLVDAGWDYITTQLFSLGAKQYLGSVPSRLPMARREACLSAGHLLYAAAGNLSVNHNVFGSHAEDVGFITCVPSCTNDIYGYVSYQLQDIASKPISSDWDVNVTCTDLQFLEGPGQEWWRVVLGSFWFLFACLITGIVSVCSVIHFFVPRHCSGLKLVAIQTGVQDLVATDGVLFSVSICRICLTFALILGHVGSFSSFAHPTNAQTFARLDPWGREVLSKYRPLVLVVALSGYLHGKSSSGQKCSRGAKEHSSTSRRSGLGTSSCIFRFVDSYMRMVPTLMFWYAWVGFVAHRIPHSKFVTNYQHWWPKEFPVVTALYNQFWTWIPFGPFRFQVLMDSNGRPESLASHFSLLQLSWALRLCSFFADGICASSIFRIAVYFSIVSFALFPAYSKVSPRVVHPTVSFDEVLPVGVVCFVFSTIVQRIHVSFAVRLLPSLAQHIKKLDVFLFLILHLALFTLVYMTYCLAMSSAGVESFTQWWRSAGLPIFCSPDHGHEVSRLFDVYVVNPCYGLLAVAFLNLCERIERCFDLSNLAFAFVDPRPLAKLSFCTLVVHSKVVMFLWDAVLTNHFPMPSYTPDLLARAFLVFILSSVISLWNFIFIERPCVRIGRAFCSRVQAALFCCWAGQVRKRVTRLIGN